LRDDREGATFHDDDGHAGIIPETDEFRFMKSPKSANGFLSMFSVKTKLVDATLPLPLPFAQPPPLPLHLPLPLPMPLPLSLSHPWPLDLAVLVPLPLSLRPRLTPTSTSTPRPITPDSKSSTSLLKVHPTLKGEYPLVRTQSFSNMSFGGESTVPPFSTTWVILFFSFLLKPLQLLFLNFFICF
jgi:hypothetical protein